MSLPPIQNARLGPVEPSRQVIVLAALGQALQAYHVDFVPHALGRCEECREKGKCGDVEFCLRFAQSLGEAALADRDVQRSIRFAKMRTKVIAKAWAVVKELNEGRRMPSQADSDLCEAFVELIGAGGMAEPDQG